MKKHFLLIALAMITISGFGQALSSLQKGTARNQIPVTNGKFYTQVYRDAKTYILDTLQIRDSIMAIAIDSIYLNAAGDTIFLRDGSGYVVLPQDPCPLLYTYGDSEAICGSLGYRVNKGCQELYWFDGTDWTLISKDCPTPRIFYDVDTSTVTGKIYGDIIINPDYEERTYIWRTKWEVLDHDNSPYNEGELNFNPISTRAADIRTSTNTFKQLKLIAADSTVYVAYHSVNTIGIKVDTSKIATQHDLTLITTPDNQKIDTFSIVANKLRVSNERDGERYKEVDLAPYLDNTDAQNINILAGKGTITLSGSTPSKITLADSSATNEKINNIAWRAQSGADSLQINENGTIYRTIVPDFLTGTGAANKVAFYNSANTLSTNTNFHFDNTNTNLGIGTTSPASRLSIGSDGTYNGGLYVGAVGANSARIVNFGNVFEFVTNGSPGWVGQGLSIAGANRRFEFIASANVTADNSMMAFKAGGSGSAFGTPTSGAKSFLDIGTADGVNNLTFSPTSGTATYTTVNVKSTINQTGGANGVTRGIFVNPLLTAVADYRAYETDVNTGFGFYQSGASAKNYFNGNTGIGLTNPTSKLHVSGDARVTGAFLDSSGDVGTSGQTLSSTVSGTNWVAASTDSQTLTKDSTGTAASKVIGATISNGNRIAFRITDNQDLSLSGNTLSLTNDASTVDLTPLTANQTITLGNELTGSGTTTINATINNNAVVTAKINDGAVTTPKIADDNVTFAKMNNVASGTVFYRKTALTGDPEIQTLATLKTDLGLANTNNGDQTLSISVGGGRISLSGSGSVVLNDSSATNEIQTIDNFSIGSNTLSLSLANDGLAPSTVSLAAYLDNTDSQTITKDSTGTAASKVIGYTVSGGGRVATLITDNQDLTITGHTLSLTRDGSPVTLDTLTVSKGLATQFDIRNFITGYTETDPLALKTAGDLSPLFQTTESSNNLAFAAVSQSAGLVYASAPSAAGVPAFRAIDSLHITASIIGTTRILDASIESIDIQNATIDSVDIAPSVIGTTKIIDNSIVAADLKATGVTPGTYNSLTVNSKGQVTAGTTTGGLSADANVNKYLMKGNGTTLDTVGIYQVRLNKFNIGTKTDNNQASDSSLTISNPFVSTLSLATTSGTLRYVDMANDAGVLSLRNGTAGGMGSVIEFGLDDLPTIPALADFTSTRLVTASPAGKIGTLPTFTTGSVIFADATGLAQDNANLFFDNTNNRLGIGTTTPARSLHTTGSARIATAVGTPTTITGRDATNGDIGDVALGTGLSMVTGTLTVGTLNQNTTGNAATATTAGTLTTGRTIGMTGDVLYTSGSFNGSANVTGAAEIQPGVVNTTELANDAVTTAKILNSAVTTGKIADGTIAAADIATTGVTAGTYNSVTVNAQGQVTAATAQNLFDGGDVSPGTGISISGNAAAIAITNSAPNVAANLTFSNTSSPVTLASSDGTDVTFTSATAAAGSGIGMVATTATPSNLTLSLQQAWCQGYGNTVEQTIALATTSNYNIQFSQNNYTGYFTVDDVDNEIDILYGGDYEVTFNLNASAPSGAFTAIEYWNGTTWLNFPNNSMGTYIGPQPSEVISSMSNTVIGTLTANNKIRVRIQNQSTSTQMKYFRGSLNIKKIK